MGTDIDLYVEHKVGDRWTAPGNWAVDDYGDADIDLDDRVYAERNYVLFAALAGVRNYFGVTPFFVTRGLPTDVTSLVQTQADCSGGHNHGYATLSELQQADWLQLIGSEQAVEKQPLAQCVGDFFSRVLPVLWQLSANEPDNVRIVYWFDS